MKKSTIALIIVMIICVVFLAGAVYLFNEIFPKAKPIRHPVIEDIVSVELSCNTPDGDIPMSEIYYKDLLMYISEARPTHKPALNDYPTVWPYYGVEVKTDAIHYRYFIYENGEQVYIEMPYEGIYKADRKLFELVLKYFEEG